MGERMGEEKHKSHGSIIDSHQKLLSFQSISLSFAFSHPHLDYLYVKQTDSDQTEYKKTNNNQQIQIKGIMKMKCCS